MPHAHRTDRRRAGTPRAPSATKEAMAALAILLTVAAAGCAARSGLPTVGVTPGGLSYDVTGAGDPVVLLHGFSLDRRMWEPQMERLGRHHRVIRFDLRGHGESADIVGPYAGTDDLLEILDQLGIPEATLVGLSAGAQLAVDFALSHPGRVDRLVLAAPGLSGYVPEGPWDWMAPVMAAVRAGDHAAAAARWAETPIMAIPDQPATAAFVRRMVSDNERLWSYPSNPERTLSPPAIGRLAEVRHPTLIVVGDDDLADIRRVAELLHAGIPDSVLRVVPGAGHLVSLSHAAEFDELLADFLASRP
jgi:3-oxoadipate enol-lactonase